MEPRQQRSWTRDLLSFAAMHNPFSWLMPQTRASADWGWSFFWRPFFFLVPVFFFFCGWLVSARTVPLLQAVAGKKWNFCRVQGFATQQSFWGLGFCNPTLLLGLKVLQPNIPFRAMGVATPHFFSGLECCNPTLRLGFGVLQPNSPFGA